jgi:serine/threonine protein kinase
MAQIFTDIVQAVDYLHSHRPPICHRDLKIENVLISHTGACKLCDFGSCTTRYVCVYMCTCMRVYVYVYTCMYEYVLVYVHTYVILALVLQGMYVFLCMRVCICMRVCMCMYVRMFVYVCVFICVRVCMSMYVCMYIRM